MRSLLFLTVTAVIFATLREQRLLLTVILRLLLLRMINELLSMIARASVWDDLLLSLLFLLRTAHITIMVLRFLFLIYR